MARLAADSNDLLRDHLQNNLGYKLTKKESLFMKAVTGGATDTRSTGMPVSSTEIKNRLNSSDGLRPPLITPDLVLTDEGQRVARLINRHTEHPDTE